MSASGWLDASEFRVGLGCMRLSTDADRDEERALATIAAAADACDPGATSEPPSNDAGSAGKAGKPRARKPRKKKESPGDE